MWIFWRCDTHCRLVRLHSRKYEDCHELWGMRLIFSILKILVLWRILGLTEKLHENDLPLPWTWEIWFSLNFPDRMNPAFENSGCHFQDILNKISWAIIVVFWFHFTGDFYNSSCDTPSKLILVTAWGEMKTSHFLRWFNKASTWPADSIKW